MATLATTETGEALGDLEATNFPQILDQCLASAVIATDDQHRIIAFTPEAAKLTGLSGSETAGKPLDVLPSPLREIIQKTFTHAAPIQDRQILLPAGPKGQLVVRVSATPTIGPGDKCTGVVAVLNDLTPARNLDQSLRRLDRLASIGTLSASMAHEIKNAMVAVKTFVDLLIKKNQDAALAEIVGREMRRIDSIVSQMLRFSGPAKPTFALVHVHDILEQSFCLIQHHLEGRKIKLVRSFGAESDLVRGDAYQLEQAFLNLLFNGLEAIGPSGELILRTEILPTGGPVNQSAPVFCVTIKDSGIGIPPENLGRLFEPFFTTKPSGTGLGLPITKRIIQEHRGVISVESQPNEGTSFTVLLPSARKQS